MRDDRIAAVRRFNRFYTRQIGLLGDRYLGTGLGLTEARVIYELAQAEVVPTSDLRAALGLDAGYLSRLLVRLRERRIVQLRRGPSDRRRQEVRLTAKGRRLFATLDRRSASGIGTLLSTLPETGQRRLVAAMQDVQHLLEPSDEVPAPVTLRSATLADLGWVLERHAVLYGDEHGFGAHFVADVARILAAIAEAEAESADGEGGQRGWIAEQRSERVGAVWCVRQNKRTARLRLLLVEPAARGTGLGTQLVDECVSFARAAGYRRIVLFTQDVLAAARRIYERAGFTLVARHPDESYGPGATGEEWALEF